MKKDLNKTKEQLSFELNDLRNKSKEREEMQEIANQQLSASEQQLRAANQQLDASNQQLSANEQQLRASEKGLKKEKEFSENLLITANAFILTLDINANITLFNKFAEKLTAYKKDEVIGKNWFDIFIPKQNGKSIPEVFSNVLKEMPEFSSYENPVLCKNGSERLIKWENTVLRNENGEISGILSIGTDITERKQAEENARAANQQLTASEQQLRAANQQLDASNQQLSANEHQLRAANNQLKANNQQLLATEQQLRTSNQQLLERLKELDCFYGISKIVEIPDISFEEIFRRTVKLIPDSWQHSEIAVCRIIFDGIEYKTHNFKKTKWSQSSDIIIDGKHIGNIEVCYLKKMQDSDEGPFLKEEKLLLDALAERLGRITKRIQTEKALKENEQFLNSILESVQDGVSVLDSDLTINHVNGVMNKWYKENLPLEGKKCYEVYQNLKKPCDPCPTLRSFESGKTEWNIVQGLPGSPVEWMELFSYPIKEPNSDKVTGVVEFVRDITKRKQAELELEKYREHLEELIKERTKELEEKNKELERFNNLFVGREFRIKELKDKVKELEKKNEK